MKITTTQQGQPGREPVKAGQSELLGGWVNGMYYPMLCTRADFEAVRRRLEVKEGRTVEEDDVWDAFDDYGMVNPWDDWFDEYEPVSPCQEHWDFEARRRIIAVKMGLDPDTATWFHIRRTFEALARRPGRIKERRRQAAELGLDPRRAGWTEIHSERQRRILAVLLNRDPKKTTWEDINQAEREFHIVNFSHTLDARVDCFLYGKKMTFDALVQTALDRYLNEREPDSPAQE